MTNGIRAQLETASVMSQDAFTNDGIRFDSDVCTAEDERLETIKNQILAKLRVRMGLRGPFRKPAETAR